MTNKKISALTAATTPLAGTELVPITQSGATVSSTVANLTAGRSVATGQLTATSTTDSGVVAKGWSPNGGANSSNGSVQIGGVADYSLRLSFDATGTNVGMAYFDNTFNDSSSKLRARLRTQGTPINGWTLVPNGSTADLQLDTGNLIPSTAAKGINFTANTPTAGMTSQLLNNYEEGTWTPVFATLGGGLAVTYAAQIGTYTRIGRLVFVVGNLQLLTKTANGTGDLAVSGLPFTVQSSGGNEYGGSVGLSLIWASNPCTHIQPEAGTKYALLMYNVTNGACTGADLGTACYFRFSITYQI